MKHSKRILLVDDDVDDQVYFLDAISEIDSSIECKISSNGLEALQHIQLLPQFDLIFLDLNMPIMNGFECLNSLRANQNYRDIPVIIFTTSKNVLDIERAREMGANLFLTKPTNFNILCSKLKQVFEMSFPAATFLV